MEPGTAVLIVDDDPAVCAALVELLSVEGYEVRTAASAEKAWEAIHRARARPAAIVLDVWLPGMSGREFVTQLRASPHAAIPVVVLSGAGWTEMADCDGDAVLRKPVEGATVVRVVDDLVLRGRGRTAESASSQSSSRAEMRPARRL